MIILVSGETNGWDEEKKRAINNYEDHVYDEIDAYLAFQEFREKMLDEIDNLHAQSLDPDQVSLAISFFVSQMDLKESS